jgi:hypothetical protein
VDPQLLFITDEAWIYIGGHVTTQNVRIWNGENPRTIQQVPSHGQNMGFSVL